MKETFLLLLFLSPCLSLVKPENSDSKPKLIFARDENINVFSLRTGKPLSVFEKKGRPVGVTFDVSREQIYWTDVETSKEAIYRSKLDGSEVEAVVNQGLISPEGIAFDWIVGNIYFTDSDLSHIVVCDRNGLTCSILVQEKLDKPRAIVLHPSSQSMYWTDWGTLPSISIAGMDGSNPRPIITKDLDWPNGLTIDHTQSRLYWVDAARGRIETTDLTGQDRRIIRSFQERVFPFSLDVSGDRIYWSDWNSMNIQSCNKLKGDDSRIFYSSQAVQVNGVTIFDHDKQADGFENPCASNNCSHVCVLSPGPKGLCKCPVGTTLQSDQRTCQDDGSKPKLFVAEGKSIRQMHFNSIGRDLLSGPTLEGLHIIGSITYNPHNKTFIIFEPFRRTLFSYNPETRKLVTLVTRHLDAVKGISVDAVTRNLYWVDAGKETVEVMSLQTGARVVLYTDEDRPFDIVAAPEVESLFVSIVGRKEGRILRMSMDGQEIHRLVDLHNGEPVSLTYSHESGHLLWCDPIKGTIEAVTIDGEDRRVIVARMNSPFSLLSHGNKIFWTERTSRQLNSVSVGPQIQDSSLFIGDLREREGSSALNSDGNFFAFVGVVDNDLGHLESLMAEHECSNRTENKSKCSHICLMSAEKGVGTCMCPEGLKLDEGGQCVPLETCFSSQFECDDGKCISLDSKCDNFRDCRDGEDEVNCTQMACSVSDFVCLSDLTCISGDWRCDGEPDCHDGSDEMNCPSKSCSAPYSFRCILGRCIPSSWQCDRVIDCPDHSDEQNCNYTCQADEFSCAVHEGQYCIPTTWICDGEKDCLDGSDEPSSCLTNCTADEFRCRNLNCMDKSLVCNGRDDCGDNSNEVDCPFGLRPFTSTADPRSTSFYDYVTRSKENCARSEFWCLSGECLSFDKVCDDRTDCSDGSDEGGQCEVPCGPSNGCSHRCHKSPGGPVCTCSFGYRPSEKNPKACQDVDECQDKVCDHYCQNLKGTFKCSCHHDYILKPDHRTCRAQGDSPLFVYSRESKILVTTQDFTIQNEIHGTPALSGVDVNNHAKNVYWTDSVTGIIWKRGVDKDSSPEMMINGLTNPSLISYDWISNNAIVIDHLAQNGRNKKKRLVMKLCSLNEDSSKRGYVILYHLIGHEVTSMTLELEENSVFWTVVSLTAFGTTNGAIQRANLDSTGEITTLAIDKVMSPTGIAVDHVFKRVYWIDTVIRTVQVVNFDGSNRATIISSKVSRTSNSLTYFDNWFVWSDEIGVEGCRADEVKVDCGRLKNVTDVRNFVISQQTLQPSGIDPCKDSKCSFICTGRAKGSLLTRKNSSLEYVCFCPEGFKSLDWNNFNCIRKGADLTQNVTLLVIDKREENETKMNDTLVYFPVGHQEEKKDTIKTDLVVHDRPVSFDRVILISIACVSLMLLFLIIYGIADSILSCHSRPLESISCVQSGSSSLELVPLKV